MQGNCNWAGCVGRALMGLCFIALGVVNFMYPDTNLAVLGAHGLPHPDVIFNVLILINVVMGILLVIGKCTRLAAWILIILAIVTVPFFLDFWNQQAGPAKIVMALQFITDVALIGGLLLLAGFKKNCG